MGKALKDSRAVKGDVWMECVEVLMSSSAPSVMLL